MILIALFGILLLAGFAAWVAARWSESSARWIALCATAADFATGLFLLVRYYGQPSLALRQDWLEQLDWNWIPRFGIHFHLAIDGLSLLLLMLTFFLGIV